jgi:hypothetical protein
MHCVVISLNLLDLLKIKSLYHFQEGMNLHKWIENIDGSKYFIIEIDLK